MMIDGYAKAYTEVLEILKYLPIEEYKKIPKTEIEFYKENKDENYIYEFDSKKQLSEQNISKEAYSLIIKIFRDYFANDKQKEILAKILINNEIRIQKELQKQFNYNDIFQKLKSNKNLTEKENVNNTQLIQYEEKLWKKILKKIKIFLKRN